MDTEIRKTERKITVSLNTSDYPEDPKDQCIKSETVEVPARLSAGNILGKFQALFDNLSFEKTLFH